MLLYDSGGPGNCYKVRLLLAHLGLEYERRELDVVDRLEPAEVLGGLKPGLRVPTLVLDDGGPRVSRARSSGTSATARRMCPATRTNGPVLQWMFLRAVPHEPYVAVARFWLTKGIEVSAEDLAERQRASPPPLDAMQANSLHRVPSSASVTRSPTSPSTPTRTSPTRAASTWGATGRSVRPSGGHPARPRPDRRLIHSALGLTASVERPGEDP